nr:unnamed protein product [Callosobruchus analis]
MFGCDPCNRDSGDGRACLQCNAIFERQITLDEHILRTHPNSIASVTSKIHQCTRCAFKTTVSGCFKEHLSKHPETSSNKFSTCTHCDATFKRKSSLDNHLIKQHPNFISSVTNKIHKCTKCSYETTISSHLKSHLSKHSETPAICTFSKCLHCKASFRKKISLDDHILKNHPNFVSSVTSKVHKCTKCNFETTIKHWLDNHVIRKHPNFIDSVTSKVHECTLCGFKTTISAYFKRHMLKHPETISYYNFSTCTHCDRSFRSKSLLDNHLIKKHPKFISSVTNKIHKCTVCSYETTRKHWLDNHVIRKHPNFIDSVTSKVHECILCGFKTTISAYFKRHMLKHPETSSNYRFSTCTHCDRTFKTKSLLDNHLIKKHPNFVSSVTNKIHKCTMCSYETTKKISLDDHIIKYHPSFASSVTSKVHKCTKCNFETTMCTDLKRHSMKHAETPDKHMLSTCRFCQATFKSKTSVDDHILRKHPNFIASVTSKLHECTQCAFKTTARGRLKKHLLKHSETSSDYNFLTCTYCNLKFKSKSLLDSHVIKKHPNFVSSVTSKIYKCTKCAFETTINTHLKRHSLKHTETRPNHRPNTCALCHASFKTKRTLDNHTLQKHPKFIDSVTSKIHECTLCTFKTTMNAGFKEHLLKHPETISSYKFSACTHCDQTFKRKYLLDNHVLRHMKVHSKTLPNLTCVQCNTTFKRKIFLDDHIVKKHPDFMESVTSRIHECRKCTFKTAFRNDLNRHSLNHLETAPSL